MAGTWGAGGGPLGSGGERLLGAPSPLVCCLFVGALAEKEGAPGCLIRGHLVLPSVLMTATLKPGLLLH